MTCLRVPGDELREISFGDWEGLTYDEINNAWPDAHKGLFARPDITDCPNGESFTDVQKRAVAKLQELVEKHQGESFVIAAHGGVNRTILCYALGLSLRYMWNISWTTKILIHLLYLSSLLDMLLAS